MIRFPCPNPNCDRDYTLPDGLAGLPLICKGCGQRMAVPGAGETIHSPREQDAPADHDADPAASEADPAIKAVDDLHMDTADAPNPVAGAGNEEPSSLLSDEVMGRLDVKPGSPPKAAAGPAPRPTPPGPPGRRALGVAADVAVGLLLATGGALLGEFVARRSTGEILQHAGAAPLDLVVLLGCVAMPPLVYVLLANRGASVGGWLRRRFA